MRKKERSFHRWVPLLSLLILCPACGGDAGRAPHVATRRGEFEKTLKIRGRLEATRTYTIRSRSSGKISFMIPEGSIVEKGDALFELETTEVQERLDEELLDLAVVEANLEKNIEETRIQEIKDELSLKEREASLELARIRVEEAREDLAKKKRQVEMRILPRSELTAAELSVKQSELSLTNAEIDLKRLREEIVSRKQTQALDRRTAEARVTKQRSEVKELQEYLDNAVAYADRPGIVIHTRNWRNQSFSIGDQVWRDRAVMELPDLSEMQVACEVNEVDIAEVEIGQPARVRIEAFSDSVFDGSVKEVSGVAKEVKDSEDRSTGVHVFDVKIAVSRQDSRLRPGMSATVEIVLDRREEALLLPIAALRWRGESSHVILPSGKNRAVEVEMTNTDYAVIAGGLEEGDEVLILPAAEEETSPERKEEEPERIETREGDKERPSFRPPLPGGEGRRGKGRRE